MSKFSLKGHSSMLAANVMWGFMSPLSKMIMSAGIVSPLVVVDLRVGGAMLLFWLVSLLGKPEHVGHKDMMRLFVASLLAIVLNQGSYIFGISLTTPGTASIITTSMPLWAMILAAAVLKEPITGKKVMGIAAGAGGALLLILGSGSGSASSDVPETAVWGDLLVLFAQLSYACYLVFYKKFVEKYSMITIMKWMFTYAFICMLPFSARDLVHTDWASLGTAEIAGLAYIVVFATFVCYMLVVVGQKNLRPTVAGMYNYVQPIVACIVAVMWGMDSFNLTKGLAVLLIFGGVYLVNASKSRADLDGAADEH